MCEEEPKATGDSKGSFAWNNTECIFHQTSATTVLGNLQPPSPTVYPVDANNGNDDVGGGGGGNACVGDWGVC